LGSIVLLLLSYNKISSRVGMSTLS
jgi:hypothetical protein